MAGFDDILDGLHTNGSTSKLTDSSGVVTVNEKREFELPSDGYDTVLAYSGDINSQIITFQLPSKHENHDLHGCTFKKLKWKNLSSGLEGISDLVEVEGKVGQVKWEIPPEAFTQAGVLEISISLYDKKDGKIVFSWNTPTSTIFSVGSGFEEVSLDLTLPAENEILLICENKQIVAPKGYNNVVANYGDKNSSTVYFQCQIQYKGFNLLDSKTKIEVITSINDFAFIQEIPFGKRIKNFVDNHELGGLVTLIWDISPDITNNSEEYIGSFPICIRFTTGEDPSTKILTTNIYTGLTIGNTLMNTNLLPEEVPSVIASNLSGNETTRVPSVRAVNNGLAQKQQDMGFVVVDGEICMVVNDIIGNVDSENNIILTGNLAAGTYFVKYEMEDGSAIDIGELVLVNPETPDQPEEPDEPTYTNFFDETQGFRGRLSSKGENRTDVSYPFVTNYIGVQKGDVVAISGCDICRAMYGGDNYFMTGYNTEKANVYTNNSYVSNKYWTVDLLTDEEAQLTVLDDSIAYFRFVCCHPESTSIEADTSKIIINIKRDGAWL